VPIWDYKEKEEVQKYYPQYYHKTDKVGDPRVTPRPSAISYILSLGILLT
jgi:hypothetical protein